MREVRRAGLPADDVVPLGSLRRWAPDIGDVSLLAIAEPSVHNEVLDGFLKLPTVTAVLARLPSSVEAAAFRIVQEAVGNAVRHASAPAISIAMRRGVDAVSVAVRDSGVGFAERFGGRGLGLDSMRERARLVGGRLAIVTAPGAGTVVEAWLPLDARG